MTETPSLPLRGLRVISLAEQYPGPYATLLMADLGAEVIQVERPQGGDPARISPIFHAALNRNKASVTLDLKTGEGRDALAALLKDADVLMEGYRPGTMDRLGFGYAAVRAINPGVVYASITGYGQDGPYRDRPAHDLSYQAVAGLLADMTRAGSTATPGDLPLGDLSSGMFAVIGVLSAIVDRGRTGKGAYVDVSMTDGLVSWMGVALAARAAGRPPLSPAASEPGYGVYACADGRLVAFSIAYEDWFWTPLCETIGLPELAGLKMAERWSRTEALRVGIAERIATRPLAHWAPLFDRAHLPWGPVSTLDEVLDDPHFRARGLFRGVPAADGGIRRYVAQPLKIDGVRPGPVRDAPALGADNDRYLDS